MDTQDARGFWPNVARDPNAPDDLATYARWLDDVEKVVFSHTLTAVAWKNARLATKSLQGEIAALKRKPGKNIVVLCSTRLGQSLLEAGLVDTLRLNVLPVVLGAGRRLFPQASPRTKLRLAGASPLPSGVLMVRYECERETPASR